MHIYTLNGLNEIDCTRPTIHQHMQRATHNTGVVGFSLQEVDRHAQRAQIKVAPAVSAAGLERYMTHLKEGLGLNKDSTST